MINAPRKEIESAIEDIKAEKEEVKTP